MKRWLVDHDGDLERLARDVRAWIPHAADSPLYALLATRLADDPDMLRVLARVPGSPPLNILFAAVQMTVTADDALGAWYGSRVSAPRAPDQEAYEAFRGFVLAHEERLEEIGRTHRTQTNEMRRCAVLMPAIAEAIRREGWDGPVHAIEAGAAAGLLLGLDALAYRYGATRLGEGPIEVAADLRGGLAVPSRVPRFATRTGLDLAPVDVDDPDAVAWLEALVWPEHQDRRARLRDAVALRRSLEVRMVAGDAAATLPRVAEELPDGPIVLWHSIALYQLDDDALDAFDAAVEEVAARRPLVRVAFEPALGGNADVRIGLRPRDVAPVATAHAHGAWIDAPRGIVPG
ncbi:DUF2332 domain-containing protein [Demequina mangrovi]|uniref:DUF2332 domain-containing protein n=1 Tax=Demequina mangrovi TaxID=1043493 RepID=A0A1H7ACI7_9MICO|nr:DUF2332 domain-containing protein [Demequina mangrovi]SEJ59580.1 hypothetical protein SAMN05421637_2357 [Demequina mangrovi]